MNRRVLVFIPLILLAACGSGQQHTAQLLDHRLQASLASEIASGQAVVQKSATGDRVTLLGSSLFPNGPRSLDDQNLDIRADVIEALLDPRLMEVKIGDSSTLPANQRDTRVTNVEQYFTANGLGLVLVPADPAAAPTEPAGLEITISVVCPPPDGFIGYRDGRAHPVCD